MSPRRRVVAALIVLLASASTGCGSDDDSSSTSTTTAPASSSSVDVTSSAGGDTTGDDPTDGDPVDTSSPPPEPLDDQTPPGSINGITVQGDSLWIASIGDDQLLQVDRATGAILARHDTGGAGPDDVAVAPDGSIYSTGYESGVLGRVVDGAYEEVVDVAPLINPIDVADDGTVWVASMSDSGELFRIVPGSEPESVASGLVMVNGFEFDEETGTILGPSDPMGSPAIVRIDPADGSVEKVVEGLPAVLASTWHPDGRFIALGNIDGQVLAVDVEAGTFEVLVTVPDGAPFDNLAYADDGTLYLSSFVAPTVTEVKPDGTARVITIGDAAKVGG